METIKWNDNKEDKRVGVVQPVHFKVKDTLEDGIQSAAVQQFNSFVVISRTIFMSTI